ncbi:glycosyltransferase family 4 protein [Nitratifractor sp.]
MRVLQTEWMQAKGGQTFRVLEELRIIRDAGWDVCLATSPQGWLHEAATREGFRVFPIEFHGPIDLKATRSLYRIIRDEGVELVHCHSSKDGYPALYAAKLARIPCVRSKHIGLTKKPSVTYNFYDGIVTTGSRIIDEMREAGIQNRFVSIPSFPDASRFYPDPSLRASFRSRYGIEASTLLVGTLSGTNERKRPHFLVEFARRRPDVTVFIAGQRYDDDYSRKLLESIETLSNVRFIDFQDPQEFLNGIDLFVCPSSNESTTQTIPQAMHCQKPAVAMNVGSISDLNVEENLPLVDTKEELFTILNRLIDAPQLREMLAQKNRRIAQERFHKEILQRDLLDFYRHVHSLAHSPEGEEQCR